MYVILCFSYCYQMINRIFIQVYRTIKLFGKKSWWYWDKYLLQSSNHKRKLFSEETFCLRNVSRKRQSNLCFSRGIFSSHNISSESNFLFWLDDWSKHFSQYVLCLSHTCFLPFNVVCICLKFYSSNAFTDRRSPRNTTLYTQNNLGWNEGSFFFLIVMTIWFW
jgi:hypothetical protein